MQITKRDLLVNMALKSIIIKRPKFPELIFTILGFLRHSGELSTSYISKYYKRRYPQKKENSAHYMDKAINYLINECIIFQLPTPMYYSKKSEHMRTVYNLSRNYQFTTKGFQLENADTRYYHTFDDMKKNKNKVDISNKIYLTKYSSNISQRSNYHAYWENILEKSHCKKFVHALFSMELKKFVFDIDAVIIENIKKRYPLHISKDLLKRKQFNIKYKPLTTGRLSSVPHIYIRKDFRKHILPANDPSLIVGSLFSLDYSANELRILAALIGNVRLIDILNENIDPWFKILKELNLSINTWNHILECIPISEHDKMKRQFIKNIFLSCQYGSIGSGSVNHIFNTLKKHKIILKKKIIKKEIKPIFKKIDKLFPEIKQYLNSLIDEYKTDGKMDLIDGIKYDRPIYKNGKRKGNPKPLKFSILNHKIQAKAAAILRRIIIVGQNLKYCEILYPVHDEVVFYCPDKNKHAKAVNEANELMEQIGKEVIGGLVPMKVTIEWENLF